MEKTITISVKITEGFANEVLRIGTIGGLTQTKTFDEKADMVVDRFMKPLYKAMSDYATKEAKELALAQLKQAESEALHQAKQLVNITTE